MGGLCRRQGLDIHRSDQCKISRRLDAVGRRCGRLFPEDHEGREVAGPRIPREGCLGRESRRRQGSLHSDGALRAVRSAGFADIDLAAQGLCRARCEFCNQSGWIRPVPCCQMDQGRSYRTRRESRLLRRSAEGRHGRFPPGTGRNRPRGGAGIGRDRYRTAAAAVARRAPGHDPRDQREQGRQQPGSLHRF